MEYIDADCISCLNLLCDQFNQIYNPNLSDFYDELSLSMGLPEEYRHALTSHEKSVIECTTSLIGYVKLANIKEFENLSPHKLGVLTHGRFELFALVAYHKWKKSNIMKLLLQTKRFNTVLVFFYNYILDNAPNAITLSFEDFMKETVKSFYRSS